MSKKFLAIICVMMFMLFCVMSGLYLNEISVSSLSDLQEGSARYIIEENYRVTNVAILEYLRTDDEPGGIELQCDLGKNIKEAVLTFAYTPEGVVIYPGDKIKLEMTVIHNKGNEVYKKEYRYD